MPFLPDRVETGFFRYFTNMFLIFVAGLLVGVALACVFFYTDWLQNLWAGTTAWLNGLFTGGG